MKFKLVVDRIEEESVVLRHDGKDIIIPKNLFDAKVKAGDTWYLSLSQDLEDSQAQGQLAKDILNEILNTDDV